MIYFYYYTTAKLGISFDIYKFLRDFFYFLTNREYDCVNA